MVELMRYINLMGPINDFDRVIERYIGRYDIQLEYASKELSGDFDLIPFASVNPMTQEYQKAQKFINILSLDLEPADDNITQTRAIEILNAADATYGEKSSQLKELESKRTVLLEEIEKYGHFTGMKFNIEDLDKFKRIGFHFGKFPLGNFRQYETFLHNTQDILYDVGDHDREYIWVAYFYPKESKDKADSLFSSFHFDKLELIREFDDEPLIGTPQDVFNFLKTRLASIEAEITHMNNEILKSENIVMLRKACKKIYELYHIYDTKKYASRTKKDFYILVGWMSEDDAAKLEKEIESDDLVVFVTKHEKLSSASKPPSKLSNLPVVKFFEFFVGMYGQPSYGEIDPTPFLAITYTILFGIMFGDLGQGAVISLLGFVLYKTKKLALGAIMCVIGISSMVFGVLYGSVFGFEDIIPAVWMHPGADINSTLVMAVILGAVIIFISMLVNMLNAFRSKNWSKLFFGPNGLAGILFYSLTLFAALNVLNGNGIPSYIIYLMAAPLVLIAFKEPLSILLSGEKYEIRGGIAMFVLETIIELFEVLLTYFTNTLSFVRVGAFALSHAGMMSVVLLMSETANGSNNLVVIVLGNILVMGLEGLVVGIQVLRLEFYEMFSRFYEGDGRVFQSHKKLRSNN